MSLKQDFGVSIGLLLWCLFVPRGNHLPLKEMLCTVPWPFWKLETEVLWEKREKIKWIMLPWPWFDTNTPSRDVLVIAHRSLYSVTKKAWIFFFIGRLLRVCWFACLLMCLFVSFFLSFFVFVCFCLLACLLNWLIDCLFLMVRKIHFKH